MPLFHLPKVAANIHAEIVVMKATPMGRWQDIRQLASLIEAEAEGQLVDREEAIALARLLAQHHPHIGASLNMIVERMKAPPHGGDGQPTDM